MELEILIIDDDGIITMLHNTVLKKCGVGNPIKTFDDGDTTLEYLENHKQADCTKFLLLLDINMPRKNGWELLDEIQNKAYKENCIVVMVSSSVNKSDKEKASTYSQVIDYVEKPFLPRHVEDLKKVIELEGVN